MHAGAFELQVPPDRQEMVADPVLAYPVLHKNVTVVPTGYWPFVDDEYNCPLVGLVGAGQDVPAVKWKVSR